MKLQTILKRIISKNIIEYNGHWLITTLFASVIFSEEELKGLVPIELSKNFYFQLNHIPEQIRLRHGLVYYLKQLELDESSDITQKQTMNQSFFQVDFDNALSNGPSLKHEFYDYFKEEGLIKIKSLTLSFLRVLIPQLQSKEFILFFYSQLLQRRIELDFEIEDFQSFYNKIEWFKRIGPVNGLLNIDNNPNS